MLLQGLATSRYCGERKRRERRMCDQACVLAGPRGPCSMLDLDGKLMAHLSIACFRSCLFTRENLQMPSVEALLSAFPAEALRTYRKTGSFKERGTQGNDQQSPKLRITTRLLEAPETRRRASQYEDQAQARQLYPLRLENNFATSYAHRRPRQRQTKPSNHLPPAHIEKQP